MTPRDILKMEIAKELGLWETIANEGWEALSNADCGRIGGIMRQRMKNQQ